MAYSIKLNTFEGPLDLLLHLINKQELDIYDIPVAQVTGQYLEYLHTMRQFDLEVASEFLVMAATLLAIKARMLLPAQATEEEPEAEDPRLELVTRLLEYRRFKEAAAVLRAMETRRLMYFSHPEEREAFLAMARVDPLEGVELGELLAALKQVLERVKPGDTPEPEEVPRRDISVGDKMPAIRQLLEHRGGRAEFIELFTGAKASLPEVVVTFQALLELVRLRQVDLWQGQPFGKLVVLLCQEGEENHAAVR